MVSEYSCPVCAADDWEAVETLTYRRGERGLAQRTLILHDLWFAGRDVIVLRSRLCRRCGFAAVSPRPTEEDLVAKYDVLRRNATPTAEENDKRRAERTHAALVAQLGREPQRVLDFGGGDGRLMDPFIARGADCYLLDHYDMPRAGVRRLGAVLDDLPDGMDFDAIVCSHVLEHLAEPRSALLGLAARLTQDGALYVEVPDQVWQSIPIGDAVTHVNFFTLRSLQALMSGAGLEVRSLAAGPGSFAGRRKRVLVGVGGLPRARNGGAAADLNLCGAADETRAALNPSIRERAARALRDRLPVPGIP